MIRAKADNADRVLTNLGLGAQLIVACSLAPAACATSPDKRAEVEPLRIEYTKPSPPPAPTPGGAFPLPAGEMAEAEREAMVMLDLPEGGVCLTEKKARAVANLRLYAEDTYTVAQYNYEVGQATNRISAQHLAWADEQIREHHEHETSWWTQNQTSLAFGTGAVVGAALATALVWGLSGAVERSR